MRFSIRAIFMFTTAVAVVCASLVYANPILGDLYYTLGLLTIAFATLAAIYRRGPQRAFWVGFVVLFAGYFCNTVWPSELRVTTNREGFPLDMFQDKKPIGTPRVVSVRPLKVSFEAIHSPPLRWSGKSTQDEWKGRYFGFMTIGHICIAFLLGILGGTVARRFALQAVVGKNETAE